MINDWLKYQVGKSSYVFQLVHVTEKIPPDNNVISFLQNKIISSYRNIEFYKFHLKTSSEKEIREYLQKQVIPSDENQFDKNVKQGDWGEILSALIVSYFQGLEVPINKLQWKLNKDKAVFCTDLLAFNKGPKITDLYYYEVKTRLNPHQKEGKAPDRNYISVIAHNSLLKDEQTPTESIADFLERLFFETKDFDQANKFKDIVKNPNNYNRNYELYFLIEKKNFIKEILVELNNLPPTLNPLNVTIVFIDNLQQLINDTWNNIENALVEILKK